MSIDPIDPSAIAILNHVDLDMVNPDGKMCGQCTNSERCKFLLGFRFNRRNQFCDWAPSRFRDVNVDSNWRPLYMCWRPETKSKLPHASCRQYLFYSTADLVKWLAARKNSRETIIVDWCPTSFVKDEERIVGARNQLCTREHWPMDR